MRIKAGSWEAVDVETVTIDGVPCAYVVECDTEEGWADCLVRDSEGRFADDDGVPRIERRAGAIAVTYRAAATETSRG